MSTKSKVVVYILNGLVLAGMVAGSLLGKVSWETTIAALTALSLPSGVHVALSGGGS